MFLYTELNDSMNVQTKCVLSLMLHRCTMAHLVQDQYILRISTFRIRHGVTVWKHLCTDPELEITPKVLKINSTCADIQHFSILVQEPYKISVESIALLYL